jgi:rhodanese-related sulfurtransferase
VGRGGVPSGSDGEELRRLIDEHRTQVVEVLPKPEYDGAHIAGAVNISLKELDEATTAGLDRDRPVVVYCNDFQ